MIRTRHTAAALAFALVLLAGCNQEPERTPAPEEPTVQGEPESAPAPAPEPTPPPVIAEPTPPPTLELNLEEPAEEPIDPSDQTLDDADATGLTTRAKRSEEDAAESSGNQE